MKNSKKVKCVEICSTKNGKEKVLTIKFDDFIKKMEEINMEYIKKKREALKELQKYSLNVFKYA